MKPTMKRTNEDNHEKLKGKVPINQESRVERVLEKTPHRRTFILAPADAPVLAHPSVAKKAKELL